MALACRELHRVHLGDDAPPSGIGNGWPWRQTLLDQVQRALLDLDEHPGQVFADDAECHQLQPAQEQHDHDQRRVAAHRVAVEQRLADRRTRQTPNATSAVANPT